MTVTEAIDGVTLRTFCATGESNTFAVDGGNHIFENQTAAKGFAFNFRVKVKRGPSGVGGYINSVQGGFQ